MATTIKIDKATREVLARSTVTSADGKWLVVLPEQLERTAYTKVAKVLKNAGGAWDRRSGATVFSRDPSEDLGMAVERGESVNRKQLYQAFYTPDDLADDMVRWAELAPDMTVLEPSAGLGALADAVVRARLANHITCVELNPESVVVLESKNYKTIKGDFLDMKEDYLPFDRIIMNPPFTRGQDVRHITHAFNNFLKPGGILVALLAPSWKSTGQKPYREFQDLVAASNADHYSLPPGLFRDSGTDIAVDALVMRKRVK